VVTEGRKIDQRGYAWPDDDDLTSQHRSRRQPDRYYDTDGPLKRGNADQLRLMPKQDEPSQWHVGHVREGNDWTNNGTPLTRLSREQVAEATRIIGIPAAVPEEHWSMAPWRCSVCWAQLDKPPLAEKARFCSKLCQRAADAARKARKRRQQDGVRKYPRDGKGWYINQRTPWPSSGLNFIVASEPAKDLEVRHGILRGVRSAGTPWQSWEDTRKSILKTA
jgi:hypothetical protein